MNRGLLLAFVALILSGFQLAVIGAGFDGDAEHLKQTRKPISLLQGIGTVDFPITCQNPQTQKSFNQGIALLHGGQLRDADRSFYQACRIEPGCPMAWWGLAAANSDNRPLAAFYADRALRLADAASDRERMWINAWNAYLDPGTSEFDRRSFLVTSLDRIVTRYPDDIEAGAFLVRQLVQNRDAGIPIPLTAAADLMIEHVLRQHPAHPIHHYKLLLWEDVQPQRALISAKAVPQILPAAALIQTAAGRLFSKLQCREEALGCFEASAAIGYQRIHDEQLHPVEIAGYVENAGLQIDQLAAAGRVREAISLARQMIETPAPESPVPVTTDRMPSAHMRVAGLQSMSPPKLDPATVGQQKLLDLLMDFDRWDELVSLAERNYFESASPEIQVRRIYAVGLARFRQENANAVADQIEKLKGLGSNPAISTHPAVRSTQVDAAIRELQWCVSSLRAQQSASGPAFADDPGERLKRLFPEIAGQATAVQLARPIPSSCNAADGLKRARLLRAAGQPDDAVAWISELKKQLPTIDQDLLPLADNNRLQPVTEPKSPRFWSPALAPQFQLPDRHGRLLSLESLRGKRVVLVFYLGAGCPHCIEQLQSFAPLKQSYEQAGLTVVAISTDSVAGLQKTFEVAGAGEAIPFLLVSDDKLSTFREFGVYDTRDNDPMHGTILINPEGRIVWHHIRREPYMATRALLVEARRIFALDEAVPRKSGLGVSIE